MIYFFSLTRLASFCTITARLMLLVLLVIMGLSLSHTAIANALTITSNSQEFSQTGSGNLKSIFIGRVSIIYNNDLSLQANKVIVTQQNQHKYLVAYGNPVVVNSKSKHVRLTSNQVTFDAITGVITATNALADYNGNKLSGALIVYNMKTNGISAKGSAKQQVKTIINNLPGKK